MTAIGPATDAEVRLRQLELSITRRLDGLLQGDYQGLVAGLGSEAGEGRPYVVGDDVRRIDWNLTARTHVPHVRHTVADRELDTWVLVDGSASLDFGTADGEKRDVALAAVAAVGFLTLRAGNRLGAMVATPAGVEVVGLGSGRSHTLALLHLLATRRRAEQGAVDLGEAMTELTQRARRRGFVVVVSDFLGDGWEGPLRVLSTRHEVMAVEVVDPRELTLPAVGVLALVDPETGRCLEVQTSSSRLRRRYADAAAEQRRSIAATVRRADADHLVLGTERDWLLDVARFVRARRRRRAGLMHPALVNPTLLQPGQGRRTPVLPVQP